jgi:hypothetical protein
MSEEEKLKFYLQKIELIAKEHLENQGTSAMDAIKEAVNLVEGELIGY